MAQWKQDPQSRENIEEVTKELELPILKPNALAKLRPFWKESWNKIEDYLLELKTLAQGKEPVINKKTGFNLDKTDEYNLDDTNKLGTARALKKLYDFLKNKIESIKLNWEGISDKPAFGLGRGEFLEGHRLAESLGVEEYGGLINQSGRKEKGKAYYDTNTKEMFLCIKSTTATSASAEDFKPFSNKALLERLENLKTNQKIIWSGNSRDITFELPQNLTFKDIQMLVIVGDSPTTLLSCQIENLKIDEELPIYYDNGVNIDSYANFRKISNTSARFYAYYGGSNAFRGWKSIAIIY